MPRKGREASGYTHRGKGAEERKENHFLPFRPDTKTVLLLSPLLFLRTSPSRQGRKRRKRRRRTTSSTFPYPLSFPAPPPPTLFSFPTATRMTARPDVGCEISEAGLRKIYTSVYLRNFKGNVWSCIFKCCFKILQEYILLIRKNKPFFTLSGTPPPKSPLLPFWIKPTPPLPDHFFPFKVSPVSAVGQGKIPLSIYAHPPPHISLFHPSEKGGKEKTQNWKNKKGRGWGGPVEAILEKPIFSSL